MARRSPLSLTTAALLACAPALPASVRPDGPGGQQWPDVAAPLPARHDGRRDAALIVSVEDYEHLPDRPGAHAVAGAWYRYLWQVRGLRPGRIRWLRDGQASEKRVQEAVRQVRWQVGRDATIWVVFIGHAASPPGAAYGVLLGPEATAARWRGGAPVQGLMTLLGHGMHRELVAVLDGCLPEGTGDPARSGLAAPTLPPLGPWRGPPTLVDPSREGTLEAMAEEVQLRVAVDMTRRAREPVDAVVFTAGTGPNCRARLPGTVTPALSYLLLGALRGWADANRDGQVVASEALLHTDLLLRSGPAESGARARPQARGADVKLAFAAREAGPAPPQLARDGRAAAAEAGATFIDEQMRKIDRGQFMLGCPDRRDRACEPDERPARRVFLDSFAIDVHEVTWRDYTACVEAGGCEKIALARCEVWTGDAFVRGAPLAAEFLGEDHPVLCATWEQAAAYCAWRGKRLPTEAEWERAARGPEARHKYPWGDAPPSCELAQTHECGAATAPVGSHPAGASPEGIHDMAGNASEWVADWYHARMYHRRRGDNPTGPERGVVKVVRGGSYYDGPGYLRASYRYGLSPEWGFGIVGFRCAR